MKSPLTIAIFAALGISYAILAGQQPSRPGEMTQARVFIENRNASDAVPVSIESMPVDVSPLRVEVDASAERVRLDAVQGALSLRKLSRAV